jgi:hypothetical protein
MVITKTYFLPLKKESRLKTHLIEFVSVFRGEEKQEAVL